MRKRKNYIKITIYIKLAFRTVTDTDAEFRKLDEYDKPLALRNMLTTLHYNEDLHWDKVNNVYSLTV